MRKKITGTIVFLIAFSASMAQGLDLRITKAINPQNPNSKYWRTTTSTTYFISGAIPASLLIAGFIADDRSLKEKSYEIFGSIAVELILSEAMKYGFNRERPGERYPTEISPYNNLKGKSFPSGHSSLAFASAASLSIQFKKWYVTVPAFLWASSVAYSRVYLGEHYFSDVVGGAAVGIGSAYLTHWLNHKLFHRQ